MQVDLKGQVAWVTGGAGGIGRAVSLALALLTLTHLPGGLTVAAEPDGVLAKPSAAELVEGVIAQERQIDSVRSIFLRFEGKWTRPADAVGRRIAQFQMQHPKELIRIENHSNLWPEMTEELELAFDGKRVRKLSHWHQSRWELRVFDGERGFLQERTSTSVYDRYSIGSSPQLFFEYALGDFSWLRVGPHSFWFAKAKLTAEQQIEINGLPKDYALLEQADFRGRWCYVLDNPKASRRLHVGVDDGRLYGITYFVLPRSVDSLPAMSKAAGRVFASQVEVGRWVQNLTAEEKRQYDERLKIEQFAVMRPWCEHLLGDYRELAPGFWFPAAQGYEIRDVEGEKSRLEVRRELRLVEAKVNEPLADDLFAVRLKDGVQVSDLDYDPPLVYQQKSDRTPEEWQTIIGDRKKRGGERTNE